MVVILLFSSISNRTSGSDELQYNDKSDICSQPRSRNKNSSILSQNSPKNEAQFSKNWNRRNILNSYETANPRFGKSIRNCSINDIIDNDFSSKGFCVKGSSEFTTNPKEGGKFQAFEKNNIHNQSNIFNSENSNSFGFGNKAVKSLSGAKSLFNFNSEERILDDNVPANKIERIKNKSLELDNTSLVSPKSCLSYSTLSEIPQKKLNYNDRGHINYCQDVFSNPSRSFKYLTPEYDTHYVTRVNFYELHNSQVDINSRDGNEYISTDTITSEEEFIQKKKTELTTTKQIETTSVQRQLVLANEKIIDDSWINASKATTEDRKKKVWETSEEKDASSSTAFLTSQIQEVPPTGEQTRKLIQLPEIGKIEASILLTSRNLEHVTSQEINNVFLQTEKDNINAVSNGAKNVEGFLMKHKSAKDANKEELRSIGAAENSYRKLNSVNNNEPRNLQEDGTILLENEITGLKEVLSNRSSSDDHISRQGHLQERNADNAELMINGKVVKPDMRYCSDNLQFAQQGSFNCVDLPGNLSDKPNKQMKLQQKILFQSQKDRKDALTKRPLNFDLEEETRKGETMKWLESHFGSESNTSLTSISDDVQIEPIKKSFFNVTIKSNPNEVTAPKININATVKDSLGLETYVNPNEILKQKRFNNYQPGFENRHRNSTVYINHLNDNSSSSYGKVNKETFYNVSLNKGTAHNVQTIERPKVPVRRRNVQKTATVQISDIPITDSEIKQEIKNSPYLDNKLSVEIHKMENKNFFEDDAFKKRVPQNQRPRINFQEEVPPNLSTAVQSTESFHSCSKPQSSASKSSKMTKAISRSFRKLVDRIKSANLDRKLNKTRSKSLDRTAPTCQNEALSETYQQYNVIDGHIAGNDNGYYGKENLNSRSVKSLSMNRLESMNYIPNKENKYIIPRYFLGEEPYSLNSTKNRFIRNENSLILNTKNQSEKELTLPKNVNSNLRNYGITESMPHLHSSEKVTFQTLPRQQNLSSKILHSSNGSRKYIRLSSQPTTSFVPSRLNQQYNEVHNTLESHSMPLNRSKSLNFSTFIEEDGSINPIKLSNTNFMDKKIIPNKTVNCLRSPSIVNLVRRSQKELILNELPHVLNTAENQNKIAQKKNSRKSGIFFHGNCD